MEPLNPLLKFSDAPEVHIGNGIEVHKPAPANIYHQTEPFEKPMPPARHKTICGFRRPTFFLSLALAAVVVLAAAIGGGVGATTCKNGKSTLAAQSSSTPTSSPPTSASPTSASPTSASPTSGSPSSTSSTATPTTTPTTSCPFSNNTAYHSLFESGSNGSPGASAGLNFLIYCDMQLAYQQPNLGQIWATTFEDCIEACASYNFWTDSTGCGQVTYSVDGERPGNCWLGVQNRTEGIQVTESGSLGFAFLQ